MAESELERLRSLFGAIEDWNWLLLMPTNIELIAVALRGDRGLEQFGLFLSVSIPTIAVALRGDRGLEHSQQLSMS